MQRGGERMPLAKAPRPTDVPPPKSVTYIAAVVVLLATAATAELMVLGVFVSSGEVIDCGAAVITLPVAVGEGVTPHDGCDVGYCNAS